MKLNWNWFKSIIDAFKNKEITRQRFIYEWKQCQMAQQGGKI